MSGHLLICITEVSDFQSHIRCIDQNIFKLNISVRHESGMHVLKRIEQLAEEVAPAVLSETGGTADVLA